MKNLISNIILGLIAAAGIVLGFVFTPSLSDLQLETLKILGIVAGSAALYCFIVFSPVFS